MSKNNTMELSFSSSFIQALWITNARDFRINKPTIVTNLGTSPLAIDAQIPYQIPPFKSSLVADVTISYGKSFIAARVIDNTGIGGIINSEGWRRYGDIDDTFPRDTPLYVSSQDVLNVIDLDPRKMTYQPSSKELWQRFQVKVNLWFTPANTNCVIHTGHVFLEVHTQLFGIGHMQKFHDNSLNRLYNDVFMGPGYTHDAFPIVNDDGTFQYPWHRYYSDTECIWMAIELHKH